MRIPKRRQHNSLNYCSDSNQVLILLNNKDRHWRCLLGGRKGIWPVKSWLVGCWAWLSIWSEVQVCIWSSWCHCHSLSLASVKSRLVFTCLVLIHPGRDKGPLNGCSNKDRQLHIVVCVPWAKSTVYGCLIDKCFLLYVNAMGVCMCVRPNLLLMLSRSKLLINKHWISWP